MIKLFVKQNDGDFKLTYGRYSVYQDGKRREGESPIVLFRFDDILIRIETTYDKTWIENLKINEEQDITKYLSDISYEDKNGWCSIKTGFYSCTLTRLEDNLYNVELKCKCVECGEEFDIFICENIKF